MSRTPLGLSLKLSPDAIASLQSPRHDDGTTLHIVENDEDWEEQDEHHTAAPNSSLQQQDGEDWDDTMAVSTDFLHDIVGHDDDDEKVDKKDVYSIDDDDDVSLAPPPCLPLVIVNLARLVGFTPSTKQEAQELKNQVLRALSQDDDDDGTQAENEDTNTQKHHDRLSRHFDNRVKELFENGMANHGDTLSVNLNNEDYSQAVIQYPEFLCRSDTDPPSVMVTARQWKRLLRKHKLPVVNRLFQHLRNCNRPLPWKMDMYEELLGLIKREEDSLKSQQEESQLHYWRAERRKQQLDKLYQVRESFDQQLEVAGEKLEGLELQCDEATAKELRRMRLSQGESGGLEALDFDTNIFSFGNYDRNGSNRAIDHVVDHDDEGSLDDVGYDNDESSNDEHVEPGTSVGESTDGEPSLLPAVDDQERSKARRKAAQKSQRRRLQSQQEAAKELARIEQAYAEEEAVRQSCATPELRMAQATVKSLEERLQQVDDLLESLQEEEWADEEEGISQSGDETTQRGKDDWHSSTACAAPDSSEFSLLDNILAMILGSLPMPTDSTTPKDHYKYIRKEHQDIVNEWKEYFGRLPLPVVVGGDKTGDDANVPISSAPSAGRTTDTKRRYTSASATVPAQPTRRYTAAELRQSLGISENADGDWDDANDDLDDDPATRGADRETARPKKESPKPVVGLRPGGKVAR